MRWSTHEAFRTLEDAQGIPKLRLQSPYTGVSTPPTPEIPKKSQKGVPGPPGPECQKSVEKVPAHPFWSLFDSFSSHLGLFRHFFDTPGREARERLFETFWGFRGSGVWRLLYMAAGQPPCHRKLAAERRSCEFCVHLSQFTCIYPTLKTRRKIPQKCSFQIWLLTLSMPHVRGCLKTPSQDNCVWSDLFHTVKSEKPPKLQYESARCTFLVSCVP